MRHKLFAVAPFVVLMLAACSDSPTSPTKLTPGDGPSLAASAVTVNTDIPFNVQVFVSCAAGGAGEFIQLDGTLHDLFHITTDAKGGVSIRQHDNPQGITGVGLTTGDNYQATGVTQTTMNTRVGQQATYVNNFRMIGQGPGNNFTIHENAHVTVNANGTVTANVDNITTDCK